MDDQGDGAGEVDDDDVEWEEGWRALSCAITVMHSFSFLAFLPRDVLQDFSFRRLELSVVVVWQYVNAV